jgi:hypothetical protein
LPIQYDSKHGGCAIICGSAPSLYEDLAKARELRPDATVVGVNFVGYLVPEIEHIWTQHHEFAHKIQEKTGRPIKIHSRPREYKSGAGLWLLPASDGAWSCVDYVWPELAWVNGSSGAAGALWAKLGMGFDEVIMAGIQLSLESQVYTQAYADTQFRGNGTHFANESNIEHWQACLLGHKENGFTQGIYSMSGYTRSLLGAPPGLES